jgi:hypothetical protein
MFSRHPVFRSSYTKISSEATDERYTINYVPNRFTFSFHFRNLKRHVLSSGFQNSTRTTNTSDRDSPKLPNLPETDQSGRHSSSDAEALILYVKAGGTAGYLCLGRRWCYLYQKLLICRKDHPWSVPYASGVVSYYNKTIHIAAGTHKRTLL